MRCSGKRPRGRLGVSSAGSFPCRLPVRLPPTSARHSTNCTGPAASSSPIPGTPAARAISRASDCAIATTSSSPFEGHPDGAQMTCWRIIANSPPRPTFRQRRFRERLCRRSDGVAANVTLYRTGVASPIELAAACTIPALRVRRRIGAREGRACRDRQSRRRCGVRAGRRASSAAGRISTRPSGG